MKMHFHEFFTAWRPRPRRPPLVDSATGSPKLNGRLSNCQVTCKLLNRYVVVFAIPELARGCDARHMWVKRTSPGGNSVKSRNAGYREGGKGLWQNGMATERARKFAGRSAFANRREARVSPGIHSPQRLRAVSQLVYPRSSGRAALQRRVNAGFLLVGLSTRCGAVG